MEESGSFFGTEKIWRILLRLAPPVMLAQLIQALYNIVDSFFVGKYSESGLTALSVIYPVQLLIIAIGVGTGVGINTIMAKYFGTGEKERAEKVAGVGTILAVIWWAVSAMLIFFIMPGYARMSSKSGEVIRDTVVYGRIVGVCSFGIFTESVWTKIHQASGNMKTPMIAQIAGALVNIILDPLLIFGIGPIPEMGIAGAAVATVVGQVAAAVITGRRGIRRSPKRSEVRNLVFQIYTAGLPSIFMQSAYTIYILGLNLILASFSDQAVTALGLYYKWQTFFFIPLGGLQTCIVPVLSYNYSRGTVDRCKKILWESCLCGLALMAVGTLCFNCIPETLLRVFTRDELVISIGKYGFHWIGLSFIPMVTSLIFPVFFQAIGGGMRSMALTLLRTVILFVPLGFLFSRISLEAFWLTFPVTEVLTSLLGFYFYRRFAKGRQR